MYLTHGRDITDQLLIMIWSKTKFKSMLNLEIFCCWTIFKDTWTKYISKNPENICSAQIFKFLLFQIKDTFPTVYKLKTVALRHEFKKKWIYIEK